MSTLDRQEQHRGNALRNLEQIQAYAALAENRLTKGQPLETVHVQNILRNGEELLASVAALAELRRLEEKSRERQS